MENKFKVMDKVVPNSKLRYLSIGVFILISWLTIGTGSYLLGRKSKVCSTNGAGEVVVDNSKTGEFICSVLDRTRIFILEGNWEPAEEKVDVDMSLYQKVWYILQDEYVDPQAFDGEEMKYESIKGLVKSADDPHTVFLTPEETEAFDKNNEGKYEGIGAEIDKKNGQIIIVAPLKGSPAEEAGLQPGDIILKVDGVSMKDREPVEAVMEIRGEKGSKVVLTVFRDGSTKDIEVTRDEITYSAIIYKGLIEDGIAHIQVNRFTESTSIAWQAEWNKAIKKVEDDNAEGIVIDLRSNTGGFLGACLHALDYFLEVGDVKMKIEGRGGVIEEVIRVKQSVGEYYDDVPVVVLVNGASASASEIFAGALQDNDRATIIGTETFGKGSVQDVVEFDDGSSMHITIQKWLLPSGRHLDSESKIEPDIVIEVDKEQDAKGEDSQMDKAIEVLSKN